MAETVTESMQKAGSVVIWTASPVEAIKEASQALARGYLGDRVRVEVHVDKRKHDVKINVTDLDIPG